MSAGQVQLMKAYQAGTDTADILVDLINACGWTVERDTLREAMSAALVRMGWSGHELKQSRGYNAASAPAIDQVRSLMSAVGLRWFVQDRVFCTTEDSGITLTEGPDGFAAAPSSDALVAMFPGTFDKAEIDWLAGTPNGTTRSVKHDVGCISTTYTVGLAPSVHVREAVGDQSMEYFDQAASPDAVTVVDGQVTCTEAEFDDIVESIVTEQVSALMAGAR